MLGLRFFSGLRIIPFCRNLFWQLGFVGILGFSGSENVELVK